MRTDKSVLANAYGLLSAGRAPIVPLLTANVVRFGSDFA